MYFTDRWLAYMERQIATELLSLVAIVARDMQLRYKKAVPALTRIAPFFSRIIPGVNSSRRIVTRFPWEGK